MQEYRMSKVGVEIRIDVSKIDKARLYKGEKGTYLTMTAFIDLDQQDQYGNNGMVTHKKEQNEERAPILGNSKVFWSDSNQQAPQQQGGYQQAQQQPPRQGGFTQQAPQQLPTMAQQEASGNFDDDIPF